LVAQQFLTKIFHLVFLHTMLTLPPSINTTLTLPLFHDFFESQIWRHIALNQSDVLMIL